MPKPVETLQPTDFANNAVWRFTSSDEPDETYVSRVRKFPLKECDSCILGTDVVLANGTKLIGYVGNLNPRSPTQNEHFLALSIFGGDGTLFHLARYHDIAYKKYGPIKFAKFLGLKPTDVFPISFSIPRSILGIRSDYKGSVQIEPAKRLTSDQLMALIFE